MHPVGDAVARVVVVSGLIVVVGVVLLITHIRRGLALPEWNFGSYGPVGRVAQSYAAAVCFISVLIAALAFVALGYELFRLVAPGVFELSGPRIAVARTVISLVYLLVAAIVVALIHSRIPPNGFWGALWSPHTGSGDSSPGGAAEHLRQTQHLQPTNQPRSETPGAPPPEMQQYLKTPRPPPPPPPRQPQSDPPQAPPLTFDLTEFISTKRVVVLQVVEIAGVRSGCID